MKDLLVGCLPTRVLARCACPILLYHSVASKVDRWLEGGLDNVDPGILYRQLESLKRDFRVVFVDDLIGMRNRSGCAAVTFDDAYRNVAEQALPVLESLGVPATIYVNTSTLEGKVFWRDKIRFVINEGLENDFFVFARGITRAPGESLYKCTKMVRNSSHSVEQELDRFLESRGIRFEGRNLCVAERSDLVKHPLLRYGNHGHRHYVMSSLTPAEQAEEILVAKGILEGIDVHRSSLFSLPFGEEEHFDAHTVRLVSEAGYSGMLLSRGSLNPVGTPPGFAMLERFMPRGYRLGAFMKKAYLRGKFGKSA